jgi:hypothetical protein
MPRRHRTACPGPVTRPDPEAPPVEITCGPLLCRLRVWSDAEWAELPAEERPARVERFTGLGWVGAVPVSNMN